MLLPRFAVRCGLFLVGALLLAGSSGLAGESPRAPHERALSAPAAPIGLPNPPLRLQSMLTGAWAPERRAFPPDTHSTNAYAVVLDSQDHPLLVFARNDYFRSGYPLVLYWTRYNGVSWSPIARVSPTDDSRTYKPRLARDEGGRIWLVWNNGSSGGIWYAVFDDGQWSTPLRVSPPATSEKYYSPVIAEGGGAVWCAWYSVSSTGNFHDVFVSRWTGATWAQPLNLTSGIPGKHWWVDIQVDSHGQPHLVWGDSILNQIFFAMKPNDGDWTSPEQISETQVMGWPECRLALDDMDGDHVVWLTALSEMAYASRSNGGWSPEQRYPPMAWGVNYPAVGCGGGRVMLAWFEFNGTLEHVYAMAPGEPVDQVDQGNWFYQELPEVIAGPDSLWVFWGVYDEWQTLATCLYSSRPLGDPVPVRITFASVQRENGYVSLKWRTAETNPGTFYVDRELFGQPRERISDALNPTGTGYSYLDASAPPVGTRYYLELLDRTGGTTFFGPYELLDGPGVLGPGARLTASPNPFRTGVMLAARDLPAGDLLIEVCSVAGRIVHREPALTGFAGGSAEFQIAGLDALPAGMYFARVRVGTQSVSTKLVKLD